MASEITTSKQDKGIVNDAIVPANEPSRSSTVDYASPPPGKGPNKTGFFTIYKKGQGYWTRMGTAIGAVALGLLITWQIYDQLPAFFSNTDKGRRVAMITAAIFVALYSLLAWRLMNKPGNADFLIATDGEMKKVNWTSKRELIGSTKVVILFMFAIAIFLFFFDQLFNTVFYMIDVLKIAPPWWKSVFGG